jgi:hypothetical protein
MNAAAAPIINATMKRRICMIKAFCNFVKISATVLIMTVLLSSIALKYISDLSMENYNLRRQAEGTSQTTACQLHISVLPILGIDWLTYDFPMDPPAIPSPPSTSKTVSPSPSPPNKTPALEPSSVPVFLVEINQLENDLCGDGGGF